MNFTWTSQTDVIIYRLHAITLNKTSWSYPLHTLVFWNNRILNKFTSQKPGSYFKGTMFSNATIQQTGITLQRGTRQQKNLIFYTDSLQKLDTGLKHPETHHNKKQLSKITITCPMLTYVSPWSPGQSHVRTPQRCEDSVRAGKAACWSLKRKGTCLNDTSYHSNNIKTFIKDYMGEHYNKWSLTRPFMFLL